jgi:hypothetical protein
VTSPQLTTAAFRAGERLPAARNTIRNTRMVSGPEGRIIRSARIAFREAWQISQEDRNAERIAFRPGRMTG